MEVAIQEAQTWQSQLEGIPRIGFRHPDYRNLLMALVISKGRLYHRKIKSTISLHEALQDI
jgi:hypothetical protein